MISAILDNPVVLEFLAGLLLAGLAFAARRVLALIDSKWANEHLASVGAHVHAAVQGATREYVHRLDLADDDGVITDDERRDARRAALDVAAEIIGMAKLRKALGLSRGRAATEADAREFLGDRVDAALDSLGLSVRPADAQDDDDDLDEAEDDQIEIPFDE